jgi:hypothetical protein
MKRFRNSVSERNIGYTCCDEQFEGFDARCYELCFRIFRYEGTCPCYKFGEKKAIKKLDAYLADYEAKHKKGGR